jgi:hypothetical protein
MIITEFFISGNENLLNVNKGDLLDRPYSKSEDENFTLPDSQ